MKPTTITHKGHKFELKLHKNKFEVTLIKDRRFYVENTNEVKVPMIIVLIDELIKQYERL